jgi:DNA mismatch repair protein MutH
MKNYNHNSAKSILEYSKKLKNLSLREACGIEIEKHGYKGKGNFGQLLEKFYFGYEPNSFAEPDFVEVGIELKSSPLKILKNKELRSKERLVLNIIDYMSVHKEEFKKSSFWKKNAHLLLVFYLYEKDLDILDYIIKLVDEWTYPEQDLKIIKQDWEIITQKIKEGRAHEISEGDTFYLGACTKGATALSSFRKQPNSPEPAKQRAYSLKSGYVNHIIANIAQEEKAIYGKIISDNKLLDKNVSIESIVVSKFKPYYGKTPKEIEDLLGLNLNQKAKSYYSLLTNSILGIELNKKIEEFEKADIQVKTVRLKNNDLPKEDISFPTFKYEELINTEWDDSDFKNILETKFFFVFYQFENKELKLKKVKFWNMPYMDISIAKLVWSETIKLIEEGRIVRSINNKGIRKTFFPGKKNNIVSHVRPHAQNKEDSYPLPIPDQLTGYTSYTKHCFWFNASYVRDEIYLK